MEWPGWIESLDREAFLALHHRLHALDSPGLDSYFRWANEFGNGFTLVAVVGLWVALRPSTRSAVRGVLEAGLAVGLTAMATRWLKALVDHPRPQKVFPVQFRDGDLVAAFGETVRNFSFPSGHSATAFALALVLASWAGGIASAFRRRLLRAAIFLVAASTGVARIYAGAHFPTDVLAGAVEGVLCATVSLAVVRVVAGDRSFGGFAPPPGPPAIA